MRYTLGITASLEVPELGYVGVVVPVGAPVRVLPQFEHGVGSVLLQPRGDFLAEAQHGVLGAVDLSQREGLGRAALVLAAESVLPHEVEKGDELASGGRMNPELKISRHVSS